MQTDYLQLVNDITAEFPFVEEMPKREKSSWAKLWDEFEQLRAVVRVDGALVPDVAAALLLDVSNVRIEQFCDDGRLKRVMFHGRRYVTENSLVEFAKIERKNGRPLISLENCSKSPLAARRVYKSRQK